MPHRDIVIGEYEENREFKEFREIVKLNLLNSLNHNPLRLIVHAIAA